MKGTNAQSRHTLYLLESQMKMDGEGGGLVEKTRYEVCTLL